MTISEILEIIGCLAITLVLVVCYCFYADNSSLRAEVNELNAQIDVLKIESQKEIERTEQAKQDAIENMKSVQTGGNKILSAKVSKNCIDAINWGIKEASNLSK